MNDEIVNNSPTMESINCMVDSGDVMNLSAKTPSTSSFDSFQNTLDIDVSTTGDKSTNTSMKLFYDHQHEFIHSAQLRSSAKNPVGLKNPTAAHSRRCFRHVSNSARNTHTNATSESEVQHIIKVLDRVNSGFSKRRLRPPWRDPNSQILNSDGVVSFDEWFNEFNKSRQSYAPPRDQVAIQRPYHATLNRLREQSKIQSENLKLARRLERVRPTRGIARKEQLEGYRKYFVSPFCHDSKPFAYLPRYISTMASPDIKKVDSTESYLSFDRSAVDQQPCSIQSVGKTGTFSYESTNNPEVQNHRLSSKTKHRDESKLIEEKSARSIDSFIEDNNIHRSSEPKKVHHSVTSKVKWDQMTPEYPIGIPYVTMLITHSRTLFEPRKERPNRGEKMLPRKVKSALSTRNNKCTAVKYSIGARIGSSNN